MERSIILIPLGILAIIFGVMGIKNRKMNYLFTLNLFNNNPTETGKNGVLLGFLYVTIGIGLIIVSMMMIYLRI